MDITRLTYKELFTVKLLHTGYVSATGSNLFNKLAIIPDTETQALFNRYGMGYRLTNGSIVCFIRAEYMAAPAREPKKPYISINENFAVRFLITAQTEFFSSTFIAAAGKELVYHFTNKANNVQSGKSLLTKPLENFTISRSYDQGTLVTSAGELFTTLQPVNASDVIPITNAAYWKKVLPVEQVVNNADLKALSMVKPEKPCLAVIDVFTSGIPNNAYALFGAGQELLSPVYTISFKSKI
jgi:hypothetical protein